MYVIYGTYMCCIYALHICGIYVGIYVDIYDDIYVTYMYVPYGWGGGEEGLRVWGCSICNECYWCRLRELCLDLYTQKIHSYTF